MTKTRKVIYAIILVILGLFFLALMADHQAVTTLLPFNLLKPRSYPGIGTFLSQFLFWGSLVILGLLLIAFFVVLFWPTNRKTHLIKRGNSRLEIDQKAINNFVKQITDQTHWLTDTKVKSKLYRKKIKVEIDSTLRPVDDAKLHTNMLIADIRKQLAQLLGLDETKDIEISVKDFKPRNKNKVPRVV